jgi:hypothetical protein
VGRLDEACHASASISSLHLQLVVPYYSLHKAACPNKTHGKVLVNLGGLVSSLTWREALRCPYSIIHNPHSNTPAFPILILASCDSIYTTQVQVGNWLFDTDYYLSKSDYNSLHIFMRYHSLSDDVAWVLWYCVATDFVARMKAHDYECMMHHPECFCISHCCGQPWQGWAHQHIDCCGWQGLEYLSPSKSMFFPTVPWSPMFISLCVLDHMSQYLFSFSVAVIHLLKPTTAFCSLQIGFLYRPREQDVGKPEWQLKKKTILRFLGTGLNGSTLQSWWWW